MLTGVLRKINEPKFGINALHVRFLNHVNCGIVSYVVSFRVSIELCKLQKGTCDKILYLLLFQIK